MSFNENPLGPSPKVLAALAADSLKDAHRYNYIDPLIDTIAKHHDVSSENVLIGCGSTEFLQFAPWALLKDGGNLILPTPTYSWCGGVAETMGREVVRVPLGPLGTVDVVGLVRMMDRNTRLVYIANPNNPTGAALSLGEVGALVSALPDDAVLLVDEAYNDFLPDGKSAIDLVRRGEPVLVTRTYSKAHGLAGLRLGYAVAPRSIIERINTVWWGDFGINAAACIAGPIALADVEHVRSYVEIVDTGLEQLRSGVKALGLEPYPHRAPFFMVDIGRRARPVVRTLYEKQIYVQDGSGWDMPNFLRISIGTVDDNDAFLAAFRDVVGKRA